MASIIPWEVPDWVPNFILNIPTHKAKLIANPTPIQRWHVSSLSDKIELFIKRDDLTGVALTGNKIRKLQFTLAKAIHCGYDTIITDGAPYSNHCRTTAVSCAQLGLECHLLLPFRYDENGGKEIEYSGNLAIMASAGAKLYRVDKNITQPALIADVESFKKKYEIMKNLAVELAKKGKKPYIVYRGGSRPACIWGYIDCWNEMMQQEHFSGITDIVVTCGSGGTTLDLALANFWTGGKKRIHGIHNWGTAADFYINAKCILEESGISGINLNEIVDVIEGHAGKGYGDAWKELRTYTLEVAAETGIFLDPVYTGKTLLGLKKELESNPSRFQGNKILFIHTGGFIGFLGGKMENDIRTANQMVDLVIPYKKQ